MKYFFDTNLSPSLVRGLSEFGEDVTHLKEHFREDTPDATWLQSIGQRGWILITRDKAITRKPIERQAIRDHDVGAFFLLGKDMDRWAQVRQIIISWHRIKEFSSKTRRPFAFMVSRSGRKIDSLPLN